MFKKETVLKFILTKKQLPDIFTKLLSEDHFVKIYHELRMMKFSH